MRYDPLLPRDEARRDLDRRLEREAMGEKKYDRMVAGFDARPFRVFGIVFIACFAAIVLGLAWLGW
jgi:hypothetical protein